MGVASVQSATGCQGHAFGFHCQSRSTQMVDIGQIYVIDDDPIVLRSVATVLKVHGLTVTCFASAADFLSASDCQCVGCVVTDHSMPGMTGSELQVRLVQLESTLSVVVVTGVADVRSAVLAMERGAITLLEKPYDDRALLVAVQFGLQKSQQLVEE